MLGAIIGEGNGTPLQYSCLENPRDGGAWWAAVYGVPQSQTRLTYDLGAEVIGRMRTNRYGISFWGDGNALKLESGNGCTNL